MGFLNRIDQAGLGSVVADLLTAGRTNAEITEVLNREHGLKIGWRAVEDYTRRLRAERAECARAAVREAIAPTVTTDINTLGEAINTLKLWFDDEGLRRSERLAVIRELRQAIDTKLKYSGAGGDDDKTVQVVFARAEDDEPE